MSRDMAREQSKPDCDAGIRDPRGFAHTDLAGLASRVPTVHKSMILEHLHINDAAGMSSRVGETARPARGRFKEIDEMGPSVQADVGDGRSGR